MPRNAELVALLKEAAMLLDKVHRQHHATPAQSGLPDDYRCEEQQVATRLRAAADALAGVARDTERLEKCAVIVNRLAQAWHYGDWKAETHNERRMEELMREVGAWPYRGATQDLNAARAAQGDTNNA